MVDLKSRSNFSHGSLSLIFTGKKNQLGQHFFFFFCLLVTVFTGLEATSQFGFFVVSRKPENPNRSLNTPTNGTDFPNPVDFFNIEYPKSSKSRTG